MNSFYILLRHIKFDLILHCCLKKLHLIYFISYYFISLFLLDFLLFLIWLQHFLRGGPPRWELCLTVCSWGRCPRVPSDRHLDGYSVWWKNVSLYCQNRCASASWRRERAERSTAPQWVETEEETNVKGRIFLSVLFVIYFFSSQVEINKWIAGLDNIRTS